ncbi:MAG: DNA recombination protein RmuC [Marmoricola sp.]
MEMLSFFLILLAGLVIGVVVGWLWARGRSSYTSGMVDQAEVMQGLGRLQDKVQDLAHQGISWQGQLRQQVDDVRHSTDLLRRETGALSTALRKPQVRGRWGEMHLRRSVELAGLVARCDFSEQSRFGGPDGTQIPDLVVHLAGGRSIVVDAKVPLDAFLDATGTDDPAEHEAHLSRHARQLRTHADALAAKSYWRSLPETPDFVVLFVPGDSFLSAALEAEPDLIERAAEKHVILATPTTLIALLRTVAMGWSHATLAERTREIHDLGRDLHQRLGLMGTHLDRLGRSLKASVEAYNRTVGSLESRVLVTARQFGRLGVTEEPLSAPDAVEEAPRPLSAIELLDTVAETREQLPGLVDEPVPGGEHGSARASGA